MRNDHNGVRKGARKHRKWGMKQDSVAWKFRTQNLIVIYSLTLRTNLEHFSESILYIHIFFKAWEVKSPTLQTMCKSKLKWRSYGHLNTTVQSWKTISKLFRNSTYEFKIQFEITQFRSHPLPLWCFASSTLGIVSRALHPP